MGVKLGGCLLTLAVCAGLGAWAAAREELRRDWLQGALAGLDSLLREVEYLASPLPEALQRAAERAGAAAPVFVEAALLLQNGVGLSGDEAWLLAVREAGPAEETDRILLGELASGLGATDRQSQLTQLMVCRGRWQEGAEQARERARQRGRLWRALGWCGGVVLVLLLL